MAAQSVKLAKSAMGVGHKDTKAARGQRGHNLNTHDGAVVEQDEKQDSTSEIINLISQQKHLTMDQLHFP